MSNELYICCKDVVQSMQTLIGRKYLGIIRPQIGYVHESVYSEYIKIVLREAS